MKERLRVTPELWQQTVGSVCDAHAQTEISVSSARSASDRNKTTTETG